MGRRFSGGRRFHRLNGTNWATAGRSWEPATGGDTRLRVPIAGTLDDLIRNHAEFLARFTGNGFRPVPPVRVFDVIHYRRLGVPLRRPHAVFQLIDDNEETVRFSHPRLTHVAAMVRHAAIERMTDDAPEWLRSDRSVTSGSSLSSQDIAGTPRSMNNSPTFRSHRSATRTRMRW